MEIMTSDFTSIESSTERLPVAQSWELLDQPEVYESPGTLAAIEPSRPLQTNPETIGKLRRLSTENRELIRNALPAFTGECHPSMIKSFGYGDVLGAYESKPGQYLLGTGQYLLGTRVTIGRISTEDKAIVDQSLDWLKNTNFDLPADVKASDILYGLGFAGVGSALGGAFYLLLFRGSETRPPAFEDLVNAGAMVGAAPGAAIVGFFGFRAISRVVDGVKQNSVAKTLAADLHTIAERTEAQFVALDDQPRTISTGPDSGIVISAGTYVQDFLKDLSAEAVAYAWDNGLFAILRDVQEKQTELADFTAKIASFKPGDAVAQGIAAAMQQERSDALDESLRQLVEYRQDMLPEAVRLSLEKNTEQDLR